MSYANIAQDTRSAPIRVRRYCEPYEMNTKMEDLQLPFRNSCQKATESFCDKVENIVALYSRKQSSNTKPEIRGTRHHQ